MAKPVVTGGIITCTNGLSPGQLVGTSSVMIGGAPALTIKDTAAFVNVMPCGMCNSMANPAVASATAAALGVLTPQPCTPVPTGTWICAGTPLIGGAPGLSTDGTLVCAFGGSISIRDPGQRTVGY